MALIEIKRNPSSRDLIIFGLLLPVFAGLVGALFQLRAHSPGIAHAVWGAGAVVAGVYLAVPPLRKFIYIGWARLTYPIGFTLSLVLLMFTYYVVLTPIGIAMRLLGRDSMKRALDPSASTYWAEHNPHEDVQRYFRQF